MTGRGVSVLVECTCTCFIIHLCVGSEYCREMAVKFNDYFEFPRELDMSPYTAATLAEKEGM